MLWVTSGFTDDPIYCLLDILGIVITLAYCSASAILLLSIIIAPSPGLIGADAGNSKLKIHLFKGGGVNFFAI